MNRHHRIPPSSSTPEEALAQVVHEAVSRYSRRVWWADTQELQQQAWVVGLEALQRFDAQRGDFYWYAWRAVVVQLRNYLWRQSAPVHAHQRELTALEGIRRVSTRCLAVTAYDQASAATLLQEMEKRAIVRHAAMRLAESLEERDLLRRALNNDYRAIHAFARRVKTSLRTMRILREIVDER
jgi:hypothetical protein